jgi:hypothetical protein
MHSGVTKEIAEELASKTGLELEFSGESFVMHLFAK